MEPETRKGVERHLRLACAFATINSWDTWPHPLCRKRPDIPPNICHHFFYCEVWAERSQVVAAFSLPTSYLVNSSTTAHLRAVEGCKFEPLGVRAFLYPTFVKCCVWLAKAPGWGRGGVRQFKQRCWEPPDCFVALIFTCAQFRPCTVIGGGRFTAPSPDTHPFHSKCWWLAATYHKPSPVATVPPPQVFSTVVYSIFFNDDLKAS